MGDGPKSRVDLDAMRVEFDGFQERAGKAPGAGVITFRAVADIVENVHLEGRCRGATFVADEPAERGGTDKGPAPLSYFLMGAAF